MPAPGQGFAWPTDRRGTRKTRGHLENISSSAKSAGVVPGRGAKTPQRHPSPPLPRRVRDLVRESWILKSLERAITDARALLGSEITSSSSSSMPTSKFKRSFSSCPNRTSAIVPSSTYAPLRSKATFLSVLSMVCLSIRSNWVRLDFPDELVPNSPIIRPNESSAVFQDLKFETLRCVNIKNAYGPRCGTSIGRFRSNARFGDIRATQRTSPKGHPRRAAPRHQHDRFAWQSTL